VPILQGQNRIVTLVPFISIEGEKASSIQKAARGAIPSVHPIGCGQISHECDMREVWK
jgi:hypothetical protein